MEKLNELDDLVLLVNSKNNPFDNYSTVKDKTILAIAEAFRALEQRAEAAEAMVAEQAKQEAIFQVEVSGNHWLNAGPVDDSDFTGLPDGVNLLYARPAPAAGLAELVPGNDLLRVLDFAKFVIKCVRKNGEYAPLSSQEPDEIAAILRNIEEISK